MEEQSKKNEYLSFKELLYFKEEIFHSLKEFENKISEKTKQSLGQFNTKIEETNTLINKYKNETNIFLTKEDFLKEKKEIINESSNLKYFNEKFNELDIQISALRKDQSDSCYKYDKIFIDHLTLPGIIGEKCKYKSIKDYIKHNIDEMVHISSLNQKNISDIKLNKAKLEDRITEFKYYIENHKQQLNHIVNLKIAQFEEKIKDKFVLIENDIKNLNSGQPIKVKKNEVNNQTDMNKEAIRIFNLNQMKNELNDKMNETLEKSKQMNLTVIRENEVTNYEINKVKTVLLEITKILNEKSEELEQNKIIKEFMDKTKTELKDKKKNLIDRSFLLTKRKNTSNIKDDNNDYSKQFFSQRTKTNIPKNSHFNLSTKLSSSKTLPGEFKDDGFILGKGNILDINLNYINKKEKKNSSLFLQKKKSGKSENTSAFLDQQNSSISFINENNNNQEKVNILKPALKQSNILYNDSKNKAYSNKSIITINPEDEIDDENNEIENNNNISQKQIKLDDGNNKKENNISQKQIKFEDEINKIEQNKNISQKQIKFGDENNKIDTNNNNLSQKQIKFEDENNNKEKNNNISQKQINLFDNENNKIENIYNISQKQIKLENENKKIEQNKNVNQKQIKFEDDNNTIEKKNNISQKKIKLEDENNKIENNNNLSQKQIKLEDENNNKEKNNNISQKQIKFKEELAKNINKKSSLNNRNNNIKNNSEDNIKNNINNKIIEEKNLIKDRKNLSTLVINEYQNINTNTNQKILKTNQNRIKNILKKNENKSEQIKDIRNKSPIFRPSSTNPNSLRTKMKNPFNFKSNNITEWNDKTIAIPDKNIIDMPLIPFNKSFLEIEKNKSYLEKRLIELEYFTKKKFDELVNEIKIFIPIHFNSYIKDYSLINSPTSKKKKKAKQITLDTDLLFHSKY